MVYTKLFSSPLLSHLTADIALRQCDDLPIIVVDHPEVRAVVALQGAQLLSWQPKRAEQQVIWLSEKAMFKRYGTIRGGIPICWPWFGAEKQPQHGFIRTLPSTLEVFETYPGGVILHFLLKSNATTKAIWPHDFSLIVRFTLGRQCRIELEARGEFTSTGAFHSCFNVNDIRHVAVSGLGNRYIDKLAQASEEENTAEDQCFTRAVDRIYTQPEKFSLIKDSSSQRLIQVEHSGFSDVVTWNPWADGAEKLADMSADSYKTLVCVETARIHQPLISTAAQAARMGLQISVNP